MHHSDLYEEIDNKISEDVASTILSMNSNFEKMSSYIDTYEKYSNNINVVEDYYSKLKTDSFALYERLYEYSAEYAELIITSNKSFNDKYNDFDILYNSLYTNARNKIFNEIYDGILMNIYNTLFDGILKNSYNYFPYDEWSRLRENENRLWSLSRSYVYDGWFNLGLDVHELYTDMKNALYNNDIEKAYELLEEYKENIENTYKTQEADA